MYYHCQGNGKPNLIGYYLNFVRIVLSNETEVSEDKDKKGTTGDCFFLNAHLYSHVEDNMGSLKRLIELPCDQAIQLPN